MTAGSIEERVQRATERLYERLGPRIIYVVCAVNVAIVVGAVMLSLVWTSRYLGVSSADFLVVSAVGIIGVPLAAAAICLSPPFQDVLRPGLSWDGDPARAPAIWTSMARQTNDATRIALLADVVAIVPPAVAFTLLTGQPWYVAIAYYVSLYASVLTSAVLWTFGGDLLLRPMLRDLAGHLPPDFDPTGHGWRLRTKALAPLPVVTLFGTLTAGAFVDVVDNGALRLTVALGIALVTVAVAGLVFLVITRSALAPLDELVIATQRVGDGHLGTRVPVLTDDDLGSLTFSFNRMVEQLDTKTRDLHASRARIVAASDAERRRVERNIHDGAQQQLVALAMKLRLLEERADTDAGFRAELVEIGSRLRDALAELRELARGLHPSVLTTDGLPAAVEQLAARSAVPVTIVADPGRCPETVESTAYFVISEALANVVKYSKASRAEVVLSRRNGSLLVRISDDGVGGADPDAGTGLAGLRDRVMALDGLLTIDSRTGVGTTVLADLPVR